MIMKAIDGTKRGYAPRPTRASMLRALYDAVEAAGSVAKIREIKELLPLTDDAHRLLKKSAIDHGLYNAVYSGYLVHNPKDDTYRIAPLSYYEARQQVVLETRKKNAETLKTPRQSRRAKHEVVFVTNWKLTAVLSWAAFFIGLVTGNLL